VVGLGIGLTVLLVAFAVLIRTNQLASDRALADRFEARAELTASFTLSLVNDLADRERIQAQRLLAGPEVDRAAFEAVVRSFDFEAAVLLDREGHLLQVWPAKPEMIGQDMTVAYAHLRAAVGGAVGVSELVPSAAAQLPIAAVAVPFDTPAGRRVLSGAFSPSTGPLGAYLDSIVPVTGGAAYLFDRSGHPLAASDGSEGHSNEVSALHVGVTEVDTASGPVTAAVADVPELPWRVALSAPTSGLYAPVESGRWAPWTLWGLLAGAGCVQMLLVVRLARARADAALTAHTDVLTGLPNRRAMQEVLDRTAALSTRHELDLAALMIDIDRFKVINDTHGHAVGDLAIRATADALAGAIREGDVAGRWGGEEFLVLLPHTNDTNALIVAERIRRAIAAAVPAGSPASTGMTASIGLATLREGDSTALLRDADHALYAAKANGRNRVEVGAALLDRPDVTLGA
jgi:diguanylate cyclase (GGDEF)-like protein